MNHHPWCNFFTRPQTDCKMCERLYRDFPPQPGDTHDTLLRRYFPSSSVRRRVIASTTDNEEKKEGSK